MDNFTFENYTPDTLIPLFRLPSRNTKRGASEGRSEARGGSRQVRRPAQHGGAAVPARRGAGPARRLPHQAAAGAAAGS